MIISLSESVLTRYPLNRAAHILRRFQSDPTIQSQLATLQMAESQLQFRGLSLKPLPRPVLMSLLKIIGGIRSPHLQRAWASILVRAVEAFVAEDERRSSTAARAPQSDDDAP